MEPLALSAQGVTMTFTSAFESPFGGMTRAANADATTTHRHCRLSTHRQVRLKVFGSSLLGAAHEMIATVVYIEWSDFGTIPWACSTGLVAGMWMGEIRSAKLRSQVVAMYAHYS